jgi:hypothetical protein
MSPRIHVPSGSSSLWGALLIAAQLALGAGSLLAMGGSAVAAATPAPSAPCVCQLDTPVALPN